MLANEIDEMDDDSGIVIHDETVFKRLNYSLILEHHGSNENLPKIIQLDKDVVTLGGRDIHKSLSKEHCSIIKEEIISDTSQAVEVRHKIIDLNNSGIFVNEKRVKERLLKDKDRITFGGCANVAIGEFINIKPSHITYVFKINNNFATRKKEKKRMRAIKELQTNICRCKTKCRNGDIVFSKYKGSFFPGTIQNIDMTTKTYEIKYLHDDYVENNMCFNRIVEIFDLFTVGQEIEVWDEKSKDWDKIKLDSGELEPHLRSGTFEIGSRVIPLEYLRLDVIETKIVKVGDFVTVDVKDSEFTYIAEVLKIDQRKETCDIKYLFDTLIEKEDTIVKHISLHDVLILDIALYHNQLIEIFEYNRWRKVILKEVKLEKCGRVVTFLVGSKGRVIFPEKMRLLKDAEYRERLAIKENRSSNHPHQKSKPVSKERKRILNDESIICEEMRVEYSINDRVCVVGKTGKCYPAEVQDKIEMENRKIEYLCKVAGSIEEVRVKEADIKPYSYVLDLKKTKPLMFVSETGLPVSVAKDDNYEGGMYKITYADGEIATDVHISILRYATKKETKDEFIVVKAHEHYNVNKFYLIKEESLGNSKGSVKLLEINKNGKTAKVEFENGKIFDTFFLVNLGQETSRTEHPPSSSIPQENKRRNNRLSVNKENDNSNDSTATVIVIDESEEDEREIPLKHVTNYFSNAIVIDGSESEEEEKEIPLNNVTTSVINKVYVEENNKKRKSNIGINNNAHKSKRKREESYFDTLSEEEKAQFYKDLSTLKAKHYSRIITNDPRDNLYREQASIQNLLEIKPSLIAGAGEGLFSKRDLPINFPFCIYAPGTRILTSMAEKEYKNCHECKINKLKCEVHSLYMEIKGLLYTAVGHVGEYGTKINHHPIKTNAKMATIFGKYPETIMMTCKPVAKGEELYLEYNGILADIIDKINKK